MWTGCYSSGARNGSDCTWRRSASCSPSATPACARASPAEGLLRRHVAEIEKEIERLTALRAELLGMLAAMPGPGCPDPLPGTWCPPGLS